MKSFQEVAQELHEAKFQVPEGHVELRRESLKYGDSAINIIYTECEEGVTVFLNGQEIQETFEDEESLKIGMQEVKRMLKDMAEEGISIEEITNEINI
tara:strand:- start:788 stop:1081 length:294 start_codon:yes stop_codon:yes gene_type:complete